MDTIIIKIYGPHNFDIQHRDWFLPEIKSRKFAELSPTEQKSDRIYLRHFVHKPPYVSGYVPKIEIFETLSEDKKKVLYILKAEFSVPKLLFGNSVQEVAEDDVKRVLSAFLTSLENVGIKFKPEAIMNAKVSAVHFCKNVPLPKDIRMQEALSELERVDISKVEDITTKEIKNGGRILHIYSGTIERVFYDKVADATRPKVKRKDKERMDRERAVIEMFNLQNREIFRYEYRIKKGQTVMRDINRALGREPKTPVVFKDLFVKDLSKTIILKSWYELIDRPENQLALIGPQDNLAMLLHILSQAKIDGNVHCLNKALTSYGLACAIRNHGAKEAKRAVFTVISPDHPERLTEKIKTAATLAQGLPLSNTMAFIDRAFQQFEFITWALLEKGI